jgi:hypothetical protein
MTTATAAVDVSRADVRLGRSTAIFVAASGLGALHWLDAAFVSPWDAVPASRGFPAAVAALLFAIAALTVWPRLPRGPRALAALASGLVTLVAGALSAWAVGVGAAGGGAWSGLLLLPAGVAMLGCAVAALRPAPVRPRALRWVRRAGGAVAVALVLLWIVVPVGAALYLTGKPRLPVPEGALGIPHEDVSFRSTDGLRLAGWYVPSRNGAAIVVVHGGGGNRAGAALHARMLARHGYGVLLYDERGRGESQGAPDALGWSWKHDVAGALEWLEQRPDVDPERIGGLGLSTGAEALVQAAAERRDLHAVVADGVEGRIMAETARVTGPVDQVYWAGLYGANRVLSASAPPPDLGRLVGRLRAPTLLVAAGRDTEARFGRTYAEHSHGRADLWQVPDAGHTHALHTHPRAYESRVGGFFDRALAPG